MLLLNLNIIFRMGFELFFVCGYDITIYIEFNDQLAYTTSKI